MFGFGNGDGSVEEDSKEHLHWFSGEICEDEQ